MRLIRFLLTLAILAAVLWSGYWYVTTAQPAKTDEQVKFYQDTVTYHLRHTLLEKMGQPSLDDKILAEEGNSIAQLNLARDFFKMSSMATTGETLYPEALKFVHPLAERGYPIAQNALGVHLRDGLGLPADKIEAYKWFNLAADRGLELARNNVLALSHDLTAAQILDAEQRSAAWMADYTSRK